MMKRLISILLLAVLVLPGTAGAQADERAASFCTLITDRRQAIVDQFNARVEAYDAAVGEQVSRLADRRNRQDEELASARGASDIARSNAYSQMEQRKQNEESAALVRDYAREVDAAVEARRQSYDEARAEFRQTADRLLTERGGQMRSAIASFQDNAVSALHTANSQCSRSQSDSSAARRQLVSELQTFRLTYAEKLRSRTDIARDIKEAAKTRRQAYSAADAEFQRAMQAIRTKYAELR